MDIDSNDVPELSPIENIIDKNDGRATFVFFTFIDTVRKLIIALDAQKIEDAPSDGKQYCRKDGAWTEII